MMDLLLYKRIITDYATTKSSKVKEISFASTMLSRHRQMSNDEKGEFIEIHNQPHQQSFGIFVHTCGNIAAPMCN